MTKFIGRKADFGIAKESVRGTAEASATFYIPKASVSIDDNVEKFIDESSIGIVEDSVDRRMDSRPAIETSFTGFFMR